MSPNKSLIEAAKRGSLDAVKKAIGKGAEVDAVIKGWTPLMWASQEGYISIVDFLLEAGADVNFADPGGFTPLKQAVGESHVDLAELLLLRGADVSFRCTTDGGGTVLHTAGAYGRTACVSLLLRYGADPKALDDDGKSAYDFAVDYNQAEAASLLRVP